jgi:hypothetical protein
MAVPVAVDDPLDVDGHTWCLFSRLPGAPRTVTDLKAEQRARGRLLADLHADTETLVDLGQRSGWCRAEVVVADPDLQRHLGGYQRLFPRQARVLRWHADHVNASMIWTLQAANSSWCTAISLRGICSTERGS